MNARRMSWCRELFSEWLCTLFDTEPILLSMGCARRKAAQIPSTLGAQEYIDHSVTYPRQYNVTDTSENSSVMNGALTSNTRHGYFR